LGDKKLPSTIECTLKDLGLTILTSRLQTPVLQAWFTWAVKLP